MPLAPIRAVAILTAILAFGAPAAAMAAPAQTPDVRTRFVHRNSDASPAGGAPMGADSAAADGSPGSAAPALTPRQPTAAWDFGRVDVVELLTFSPDGTKLYAVVDGRVVNVWAMLVWWWPEIVTIPLMLFAGVRLHRLLNDKRTPGEEYCAGCQYPLRGLTSERCPECGRALDAAGRVTAEPRRLQIVWCVLAILVPGFAFFTHGHRLYESRTAAARLFRWPSQTLWEWMGPNLTRTEWVDDRKWLVELDTADTRRRRVLRDADWSEEWPWSGGAVPAPDGRSLFLCVSDDCVGRMDVATGEWIARYPLPAIAGQPRRYLAAGSSLYRLVLSADGARLHALYLGRTSRNKEAWIEFAAWNIADGRPAPEHRPRPGPWAVDRQGGNSWALRQPAGLSDWGRWEYVPWWAGGTANGVAVSDRGSATVAAVLATGPSKPRQLLVSPDDRLVAAVIDDHSVSLFDLSDLPASPDPNARNAHPLVE